MARLLAIDYGTKRTGIAVTDELQLIASGLTTVPTEKLISFLKNYFIDENVELVIIGEPKQKDGTHSRVEEEIKKFIQKFSELFSAIKMDRMD
jgi:putative Holliday junction resolvase